MRAALYLRYSSDRQRSTSLEDQARNCRRRAEADEWTVVASYADEALSGADSSRPQYQAMLAAAKRREFDVLIVDDLSRLARDSVEQESAIRRLEHVRIRIISTADGYDSDSKARKIVRAIHGIKNEMFIDELAEKVHRGQEGQARKKRWNGGRPYGYKLRRLTDPSRLNPYGEPEQIGSVLEIEPRQAQVVRDIFRRFNDGASQLTIAAVLNERGEPSQGSTWKRKVRICNGWRASSVRVILRNPLYSGLVRWNTREYLRDPDTKKDSRRARPREDWVTFRDESLRIIDEATFAAAQRRMHGNANNAPSLKRGRQPRFLLSGLLTCAECNSHYTLADARSYACSAYVNGRACANSKRVRRDLAERKIRQSLQVDLLAPDRIGRIAKVMRAFVNGQARPAAKPCAKVEQLEARLVMLRQRLTAGDPALTREDLLAAIERAERQREAILTAQDQEAPSAQVIAALPKAAAIYRQAIEEGTLAPERVAKAREMLRGLLGEIKLERTESGGLDAVMALRPGALSMAAGLSGRGDRI